jgi:hypothetical protein
VKGALGCLGLLLLTGSAQAANHNPWPYGMQAALMSGAVTATVVDGGALYYNPAGIAAHRTRRFSLNGSAIKLIVRPVDPLIAVSPGDAQDTSSQGVELISAPSAATFSFVLGPRVSLSAGLFITRRDQTRREASVDVDLAGGDGQAGASIDWNQSSNAMLGAVAIGGAPADWLRLGGGVYVRYRRDSVAFVGSSDLFVDSAQFLYAELRSLDESSHNIGMEGRFGVQLLPVAGLRIGVSVSTPRLVVYKLVETKIRSLEIVDEPLFAEVTGGVDPVFGQVVTGVADRSMVLAVGVAWEDPRFVASVDVEIRPSLPDDPLHKTIVDVRAGGAIRASERAWIGFGGFSDQDPTVEPDGVPNPRVDYFGGNIGVLLETPLGLRAEERAPHIKLSSVIALRYDVGIASAAFMDVEFETDPPSISTDYGAPVDGNLVFHGLGLHLGSSIEF